MHPDFKQGISKRQMQDQLPLFNANNARRKAEQDSILLANRIRLLRAEEDKARKKIRDTEAKTREIIEVRKRSEEKRLARDAEESRREAMEMDLRLKIVNVGKDQQRRIMMVQREMLEQKAAANAQQRQEREIHKTQIERQQEEFAAAAAERALQVRNELKASERRRAMSEGARRELCKLNFAEKLIKEEDAARAHQQEITRMEKEEQDLIHRLQLSQERHRMAFAQLEDAIASGSNAPASASISRCSSAMDHIPLNELPQASGPAGGSRAPLAASSCSTATSETKASGSRPPRPRGIAVTPATPNATSTPGSSGSASAKKRPTSAPRSASLPKTLPSMATKSNGSRSVGTLRDETSICSTASGGPGPESAASGHSTPSSGAGNKITYTTMDGLQLEIPPEEDLDLDKLLSGK